MSPESYGSTPGFSRGEKGGSGSLTA
eukprot:SAG22_NODE_16369_length_326_cov_1.792952_1_plen_25_part_10